MFQQYTHKNQNTNRPAKNKPLTKKQIKVGLYTHRDLATRTVWTIVKNYNDDTGETLGWMWYNSMTSENGDYALTLKDCLEGLNEYLSTRRWDSKWGWIHGPDYTQGVQRIFPDLT